MLGDDIVDAMQLDEIIRQRVRNNPAQKVELSSLPGTPAVMVKFAGRAIIGSGIKAENLTMIVPEEEQAETSSPVPPAPVPAPATPPPMPPQGGTRGIPPIEPTAPPWPSPAATPAP